MPVTLQDIADVAGCAAPTVGFVLRQSPKAQSFRPEVRQRIIDAANRLGYRPNWRARALATQRNYCVGALYLPMTDESVVVYQQMLNHAAKLLQEKGYHLLLVPLPDSSADWDALVHDQRMDGWLLLNLVPEPLRRALQHGGVKAVLLNGQCDLPMPSITFDDDDAAVQMTRYLVARGHRNIALHLGRPSLYENFRHYSVDQRQAGFERVMRDCGLQGQVWMCDTTELAQRMARSDRPTAILAYAHVIAMEVMKVAWQQGLRVPEDISLASFNDVFPVQYLPVSLTVMALPGLEMAEIGANMLLRSVAGEEMPATAVNLKAHLVERRSVAAPAVR